MDQCILLAAGTFALPHFGIGHRTGQLNRGEINHPFPKLKYRCNCCVVFFVLQCYTNLDESVSVYYCRSHGYMVCRYAQCKAPS